MENVIEKNSWKTELELTTPEADLELLQHARWSAL